MNALLNDYDGGTINGSKATYDNLIVNLKIEGFKSSLSNKLPTQEKVDYFNKYNSHKIGKDLTIEYFHE